MKLAFEIAVIAIISPFIYMFLKHWLSEEPDEDSVNSFYYQPKKRI